jgi:hypothetical protein
VSIRTLNPDEQDLKIIVAAINQLAQGRSNAVGSVTLTASVATTTVTAITCGVGSTVLLFPETTSAATEFGAGTLKVGTVSNGSFIITHVNSGTADRTFRWVVIG